MAITFPNSTSETNYFYRTTNVPSGNFTFCGWVYVISIPTTFGTIFFRGASTLGGHGDEWPFFGINQSTSKLHLYTGAEDVEGSTTLSTGVWYHVALVRNASNDWKFYLNGVQDGSATSEGTNTSSAMALGCDIPWNSNKSNNTQAGVKIYSTNLNAVQLQQEIKSFTPATTTNLIAWLPMVNASVADCAIDYSGVGNFTVAGTPTLAQGPPIPWGTILNPKIFLGVGGGGVTVTPSIFTGTFSNFAPSISGAAAISPSLITAQFSNFSPIIIIETVPGIITAAFNNFSPTVIGNALFTGALQTAAFSNFAPTVVTNANVSPALISAAFSAFTATVSTDTIVEPGLFTAAFSNFAPTISGAANVAPSLITANFSNFSPTVVFDTVITPSVFTGNFDVFAPAIQAGALIPIADLTEATFSLFNPNVNPSSNTAKNSSIRVWLALGMN